MMKMWELHLHGENVEWPPGLATKRLFHMLRMCKGQFHIFYLAQGAPVIHMQSM